MRGRGGGGGGGGGGARIRLRVDVILHSEWTLYPLCVFIEQHFLICMSVPL